MRTMIKLLFICISHTVILLNGHKVQINNILKKLSIEHATANIQEIPGSSHSVMLTVFSQNHNTRVEFLRTALLNHAANIFENNRKLFEEKLSLPVRRGLPNLIKKIDEYTDKEIQDIIDYMATQTYPEISLLRECWCIKRYNDFDDNNFIKNDRGNFERMLVSKYLQDPQSKSNIVYTSFASGGMFTDLRILTLLLAPKKDLENHILFTQDIAEIKKSVAIGTDYETLITKKWKYHEKTKTEYELIKNVTIDSIHFIDPDYRETINILQENIGQDIKNIHISKDESLGSALRIVQLIQLANVISTITGKPITICLYDYAKSYVDSCTHNKNFKPTIVTSIDHNADNMLYFYGFKISYTYVECMLMLRKVITDNTWLGDLNWKTPAKIKPLLNVHILVKNPRETKNYLKEKKQAIDLQKTFIKEYEATHNQRYLSL